MIGKVIYVSLSKVCFENAHGLLINNRSNLRDEWIIVRKIAVTIRKEWIIVRKFAVNHRVKRIIVRKILRIKTIAVTKMQGNFIEILFQAKFLRKATKSQEFCRNSIALLLLNTVWAWVILFKFSKLHDCGSCNLRTWKTSQEMHERSYDFLFIKPAPNDSNTSTEHIPTLLVQHLQARSSQTIATFESNRLQKC